MAQKLFAITPYSANSFSLLLCEYHVSMCIPQPTVKVRILRPCRLTRLQNSKLWTGIPQISEVRVMAVMQPKFAVREKHHVPDVHESE
jgi:hypothetical protein